MPRAVALVVASSYERVLLSRWGELTYQRGMLSDNESTSVKAGRMTQTIVRRIEVRMGAFLWMQVSGFVRMGAVGCAREEG